MILYVAILLSAAAVSALISGRDEVVYPSIINARLGIKLIKFRAFDQDIHLRLVPAGDVISKDFTIFNGENERIDHGMDIRRLKRKLYKDNRVGASLYVDEDGPLIINGIINSQMKIEPYQQEKRNIDGTTAHRVTEISSSESVRINDGVIQPVFKESLNIIKQSLGEDCGKIETALILDSKFIESFNNDSELTQYLFNIMNKVQMYYDLLNFDLKVVLIGVIKLTKENETTAAPYIKNSLLPNYSEYVDVKKLAEKMTYHYCKPKISILNQADVILFISGRPFGKEIDGNLEIDESLGYSYAGHICILCRKYGIVQETAKSYLLALTITQEIAHLMGCVDDGQPHINWFPGHTGGESCLPSNRYIMGNTNKNLSAVFSQCSRKMIEVFLTERGVSSCVTENCKGMCFPKITAS